MVEYPYQSYPCVQESLFHLKKLLLKSALNWKHHAISIQYDTLLCIVIHFGVLLQPYKMSGWMNPTRDCAIHTRVMTSVLTSKSNIFSRLSVLSHSTSILLRADAAFSCEIGFFYKRKIHKLNRSVPNPVNSRQITWNCLCLNLV